MTLPRRTLLRVFAATSVALGASLLEGCAITPAGVSTNNERELTVSMTVRGVIDPTLYYFVVFNTLSTAAAPAVGPDPPVAPDWGGNGFVTGAATQFVEFNQSINGSNGSDYGLGQLTTVTGAAKGNLQEGPVTTSQIITSQTTTNTLSFTIPLSALEVPPGSNENIPAIQVNFINTNNVTPGQAPLASPKYFDALGNTADSAEVNEPITIPTTGNDIYNNMMLPDASSAEPTNRWC